MIFLPIASLSRQLICLIPNCSSWSLRTVPCLGSWKIMGSRSRHPSARPSAWLSSWEIRWWRMQGWAAATSSPGSLRGLQSLRGKGFQLEERNSLRVLVALWKLASSVKPLSLHREMSFLKQGRGSQDSEEGGIKPWTSCRAGAWKAAGPWWESWEGVVSLSTWSP